MFNIFSWLDAKRDKLITKSGETTVARIEITPEGKAVIFTGSTPLQAYTRYRDAVRGAARRGLVLA